MKRIFILLLLSMFSMSLFALEIDEKLTFRLLRSSSSKKTLLVNRGLEDGLTKGSRKNI